MALLVGYRCNTSMQADVKVVPGEMTLAQPAGTVPRAGSELVVTREAYATRKSSIAPTPESVTRGEKLYAIYSTPCPGVGGKGDGLVTPPSIPAPDLTSPQAPAHPAGPNAQSPRYITEKA